MKHTLIFECVLSDSNIWILSFCRLLVGAPYEMNGPYQTGDVYKCSLNRRTNGNGCSKLNLGIVSQNTTRKSQHSWHTVAVTVRNVQHLHECVCVYYYVFICLLLCLSKHHSDMCETEVWVPYQSFHILLFFLKMVYVHFHVCYTTHLTTCFFIWVAHLLGRHKNVVEWTFRAEDVDDDLAAQTAITNQSPRWLEARLVSEG